MKVKGWMIAAGAVGVAAVVVVLATRKPAAPVPVAPVPAPKVQTSGAANKVEQWGSVAVGLAGGVLGIGKDQGWW